MLNMHKLPSREMLLEMFEEKEPGVLYYRKTRSTRVADGARAGWKDKRLGYCYITINGYKFLRHRLIWKIHTGNDPLGIVNHINGIPGDDAFENLEDVTSAENNRNGRNFVTIKLCDTQQGLVDALGFHFDFWPDEDIVTAQNKIEEFVRPIFEEILRKRHGRKRPR